MTQTGLFLKVIEILEDISIVVRAIVWVLLFVFGWCGLFASLVFLIPSIIAYLINASPPNNVTFDDIVLFTTFLGMSILAIFISRLIIRT